MNLRQLRYFVQILNSGSIAGAAQILHVAPQALGFQIMQLEQDLDVKLLDRHSRGVTSTSAGRKLYESATRILMDVEKTRSALRAMRAAPEKESLILGVAPSVALLLGAQIVHLASSLAPNLTLELIEQPSFALAKAVHAGDVDVAFVNETKVESGVSAVPVLTEELMLISAAAPETDEPIKLYDALQYDLALAGHKDPMRQLIQIAAERLSCPLRAAYEIQSVPTMKEIMISGKARCILPYGTVCEELEKGVLFARRIADPTIQRMVYLIDNGRISNLGHISELRLLLDAISAKMIARLGNLASFVDENGDARLHDML